MAIDEAIFLAFRQGLVPPTIRFYGWKDTAISIGYTQNPAITLQLQKISNHKLELVRRPTGGYSVLHQDDLTYSIVKNCGAYCYLSNTSYKGMFEDYKLINQGLSLGLNKLGIKSEIHELEDSQKKKGYKCSLLSHKASSI
ncbi:MAG: hypothetical protein V1872_13155 [bacterium]